MIGTDIRIERRTVSEWRIAQVQCMLMSWLQLTWFCTLAEKS